MCLWQYARHKHSLGGGVQPRCPCTGISPAQRNSPWPPCSDADAESGLGHQKLRGQYIVVCSSGGGGTMHVVLLCRRNAKRPVLHLDGCPEHGLPVTIAVLPASGARGIWGRPVSQLHRHGPVLQNMQSVSEVSAYSPLGGRQRRALEWTRVHHRAAALEAFHRRRTSGPTKVPAFALAGKNSASDVGTRARPACPSSDKFSLGTLRLMWLRTDWSTATGENRPGAVAVELWLHAAVRLDALEYY
ncbi:hypothetical protein COCCADRAFT_27747 [Bipolaris zeicola 26-R-13]|uniref:Uncharacterized protein n=1 Tax=Cochliobolus carbonum (strain 26-R-13) TaxID=930089 RepID=W6YJQ3_COCC2|nr:uncharacterized protein COCCADRAFT_27747 [Bipolaris zeicola 26-R-13]EUC31526.1 hypothetical protein COCCADRAFT_27747 [Bipolaris zeicola 26-R-13]